MNTPPSPLLVVLGPTGSGKSSLALALASRFDGEIVNFDSVQLYRELRIGAAKMPEAERAGIPHHLLDTLGLNEELTAGRYVELARPLLTEIAGRQKLPILAGGTGFYLRALLEGLSPAPPRDPALRERLASVARSHPGALHRLLHRCDQLAASRIHPNDHQKLMRAIELSRNTAAPRDPLTGFCVLKLGLRPARTLLYQSLNERTERIFREGLLEETAVTLASGIAVDAKPLQALGYKQAVEHLRHGLPLDAAIRDCQTATRQYAKRQVTWFRSESDVEWLPGFGMDTAVQRRAIELARDFLNQETLGRSARYDRSETDA